VALVVASLLATVFVYTAVFAGTVRVLQVGDLAQKPSLGSSDVRLNGVVLASSSFGADGHRIVLGDNAHRAGRIVVLYHGALPDAFRSGRSILVDGQMQGGVFAGRDGSLTTKCPSKYQAQPTYTQTTPTSLAAATS